ncbi:nucleotidyltransferase [Heyndrickxia shackletonii]|uniref:Nucleotidyltransferase n=1 Tax=Heyndrickxia shackletonii TaxID=157838 RepID=A0A0Q3WS23_9BACI|nr:nucleotidyltransferase domain-containing protein [Heyndrickxia shackletonii]KQL50858.1 nucleotidyltransferase [Heyndrickxia shackletonii]NEZ01741.1 nucleotidyltransferase domain-containing protein [Heyndrickxia shackletonii]
MTAMKRLKAMEAAALFVDQFFSNCDGAVLAGSVVRGEETDTSDLDIVVFDKNINSSYRESFIEFGWPIEVFVHNLSSYKHFFDLDYKNAKPSMQRMIAEGLVVKDEGILDAIKEEAKAILEEGPERWTDETIRSKRYFITDVLDDFIGCQNRAEGLFIANTLANLLHEFVLRTNGRWIGTSKWIIRALKKYDEKFAADFVNAFDAFYQDSDKSRVIDLTDKVLEPYGGRLFEGFSLGKENRTDRSLDI